MYSERRQYLTLHPRQRLIESPTTEERPWGLIGSVKFELQRYCLRQERSDNQGNDGHEFQQDVK